MSKSSVVTVRETPVAKTASAKTGGFAVVAETIEVDIKAFLETTVSRASHYRHNHPQHSDCDRANADSHVRAMLLGHSVTMQVSGGELVVGRWQRVLCGEMDGQRTRTIRAQVQGIAG